MPARSKAKVIALTVLDKTNVTVIAVVAGLILYTQSAAVAYFGGAGAVFCSLSVKGIKRLIRQPRPPVTKVGRRVKKSYGMPSTHSASIAYLATTILFASTSLPLHPSVPQLGWMTRVVPPLLAVPWAGTVLMSRVWLGHHTWPQVFAGASYGVFVAVLWFNVWIRGLDKWGYAVERWALGHLAAYGY